MFSKEQDSDRERNFQRTAGACRELLVLRSPGLLGSPADRFALVSFKGRAMDFRTTSSAGFRINQSCARGVKVAELCTHEFH
jgi:hypothetical protein